MAFRAIHFEKFAEFLIATEAEVEKVHWPDRQHVHRASVVVIVTMLFMGGLLFVFDMIWRTVFSAIGFLQIVD
jgi:preprotein translocase subunit SecE